MRSGDQIYTLSPENCLITACQAELISCCLRFELLLSHFWPEFASSEPINTQILSFKSLLKQLSVAAVWQREDISMFCSVTIN